MKTTILGIGTAAAVGLLVLSGSAFAGNAGDGSGYGTQPGFDNAIANSNGCAALSVRISTSATRRPDACLEHLGTIRTATVRTASRPGSIIRLFAAIRKTIYRNSE